MNTATRKAIAAILLTDPTVSPEQRAAILKACSSPPTATPKMGGVQQVAELLDCHPKTVYRYIRRGLLHPVHYSQRKVRFNLVAVEEFAVHGLPLSKPMLRGVLLK